LKLSQVAYETETAKQVEITDHLGNSFEPKAMVSVHAWKSRAGNKAMIEMQRNMIDVRRNQGDMVEVDEEIAKVARKSLGTLIVGWEWIEDEKGKPLKFTPENVEQLLSNPYILDIIDRFASNLGNYKA